MNDSGETSEPGSDPASSGSQGETAYEGPPRGAPPPPPEDLPRWIGHYHLDRQIGQGGMGRVYLGWDEQLKRQVAIKCILPGQQDERFRREAQAAAQLSHASIVQIYDLVLDDSGKVTAIVMEYLEGTTLAERLTSGKIDQPFALRLAREIAEGLAAAHDAGFIHRDLKAENVMLTRKGHSKILDFGLAKPLAPEPGAKDLTREGIMVGTYHAMSPEQAKGEPVDHRSDLFSFGSLLYEMLSGVQPFRSENPFETMGRVISHHPPPLTGVSAEIDELVHQLLEKSRTERPQNAQEVVDRLSVLAAMEEAKSLSEIPTEGELQPPAPADPSGEPAPTSSSRSGEKSDRGWGWQVLAVAVVVLLALLGFGPYLKNRPSVPPPTEQARPIRVVVLRPTVSGPADPRLELAASSVQTASLRLLTDLEGLTPITPEPLIGSGQGSAKEIARATAVDEMILATLEPAGELCLVTMKRVKVDGQLVWTDDFSIPVDPAKLGDFSLKTSSCLQKAYADNHERPGIPHFEVQDRDYAEYLAVQREIEAGKTDLPRQLARIEAVARSSPRFPDGLVEAGRLNLLQYRSTREPRYLERADQFVQQARGLAPGDPRTLQLSFWNELAGNRLEGAEKTLAQLDQVLPNDLEIKALHARLMYEQGQVQDALETLQNVVALAPSWKHLNTLATWESRLGKVKKAREHLDQILQQAPDNTWALQHRAEIELYYGDLTKAQSIYERLAKFRPARSTLTELGLTYFLRGNYSKAADAYRRALAIDPGHVIVMLNLADVEVELGHPSVANALYRKVLERFEKHPEIARLQPENGITQAQALARLGRGREAVEATQEVLRTSSADPEMLFEAALAYCLAGDHISAVSLAQQAHEKGLPPRLFSVHRCLRSETEIQELLARLGLAAELR